MRGLCPAHRKNNISEVIRMDMGLMIVIAGFALTGIVGYFKK